MGAFAKGEVVIVDFPYSNLSDIKRRPALVLANLPGDDVILCVISHSSDSSCVQIYNNDFETGRVNRSGDMRPSNVRPTALFTADSNIIDPRVLGRLRSDKMNEITDRLIRILSE